jgi:pimeloyl-ACP methyl ester carboxylesterase
VRIPFALLCQAAILLGAYRWTYSTSGFLVTGVGLALLVDRYAFRLLPLAAPSWRRELMIAALSFLIGFAAFYLMRPGIVPVWEAAYRGAVVGVVCLAVDGIAASLGRAAAIVRITAFACVLLLTPIVGGLHPLHIVPRRTPAAFGLSFHDVHFKTSDGIDLAGWLIRHPHPRGNVIFCHGHGRNRGHVAGLLPTLHDLGLNVLAFDFRGHGDSAGHTSTFGHREVEDLLAAERFLRERCPNQPLFLVGISLGAAVSLQALSQLPHVRGVWSEGAFARLSDAVEYNFSIVPESLRLTLVGLYHRLGWLDSGLWAPDASPVDRLDGVTVPVFFCHAVNDELVPFFQGQVLYDRYTGPKQHWWVAGASHYNVRQRNHEEYPRRLRAFLEDCFQQR